MKRRLTLVSLGLLILLLLVTASLVPTGASPLPQLTEFPSPTPGPDGRIIYIVQPGDTLWRVAAITGVPLEQLRELNNLGQNDIITEGQELLLGLGGPSQAQPTAGPTPSATSELPTPTIGVGTGTLCVVLYEDANGDAIRQEEEPSIPDGAISVNNRSGTVSFTAETPSGGISNLLNPDPEDLGFTCWETLEQGDYNVTVAIPDGYNPTTVLNYPITVNPGDITYLDFGAQPNSESLAEENAVLPGDAPSGRSPVMAIVGIAILALGIAMGVYAYFLRQN